MIPKITRGGNTRGLLLYLIGKGRREEHVDPRLVAGSPEAMMIAGGRVLEGGARDAAQLARFLDEPRETFGTQVRIAERDQNGKVVGSRDAHVWHTSLSLHPDEPALSDERWGEIAERFVAEMGFAGETARAQCRWVAVRHGESTGGSDHVHLVVGLVAEDGSKANVHFERKRAQQAARLLEREFGLRELESRGRGAGSRGLEPGEIAADHRRGVGVGERGEHAERSSRQRLERVVRACAGASRTEAEFVAGCASRGCTPVRGTGRVGRARWSATRSGWRARARAVRGRCGTAAGGSRVTCRCRRCGAAGGRTMASSSAAVAEWSSGSGAGQRPAAERQAELQERGLVWHRCTMEIERVRLGLRAAGTDPGRVRARGAGGRRGAGGVVDRPGGRAARRAGAGEPAARPLRRAVRLIIAGAGGAAVAVAGVGAGVVHARRRAA